MLSRYFLAAGHCPANYLALLVNRASMKGMVAAYYYHRACEVTHKMAGWG